jgi:NAD(P)-dependent dehydrogenase (short-subunit alcohol dehydrogenase family)
MTKMPRAALVTGAGRRIGRAIALALAKAGWSVGVHYRSGKADAEAVVAAIADAGGRAVALHADLRDEAAARRLVPAAVAALGPLGALVNNAAIFEKDAALTVTRESWDAHLETNLRAPFVLMQEFAGQLPETAEGAVVNLLDERVWKPTPYFVSYTLSKSALWTLTRTMALALAPRIRVNGIGPGPTLPSGRQSAAQFERQSRSTPLQRGATPEEIAAGVLFLLQAPAVTGQMIAFDGGQHLQWAAPTAANALIE